MVRFLAESVKSSIVTLLILTLASVPTLGQQVTVSVAHTWHEPFATRIEAFDKAFMNRHPDIRIERVAGKNTDELLTAFAGGAAPDVFVGVGKALMDQGLLEDLTPFIERTPEFDFEDYTPAALSAWKRDGRLLGLPYDIGGIALYYRPNLLAQSGLAPPSFNWTNDELLEYARKLTRRNASSGEIDRYGVGGYWLWWLNAPMLAGFGARYYDPVTNEVLTPPDKAADALKWWSDIHLGWEAGDPDGWNLGDGTTAMSFQGTWAFEEWIDEDLFSGDVGIAPVPAGPEGRFTTLAGNAYGIAATSRVKEAAWTYLSEFLSASAIASYNLPELGGSNWIFSSSSPPRVSLLAEVGVDSGAKGDDLRAILSDALAGSGVYAPHIVMDADVNAIVNEHLNSVSMGETDPRTAVTLARDQVRAILETR